MSDSLKEFINIISDFLDENWNAFSNRCNEYNIDPLDVEEAINIYKLGEYNE